jgi:hypothetical protein
MTTFYDDINKNMSQSKVKRGSKGETVTLTANHFLKTTKPNRFPPHPSHSTSYLNTDLIFYLFFQGLPFMLIPLGTVSSHSTAEIIAEATHWKGKLQNSS